jgi:hypothetical protein
MQSHTCILSAFTLGTAMALGVAALVADLPKEGTFSGSYSSVGTAKAIPIGKGICSTHPLEEKHFHTKGL